MLPKHHVCDERDSKHNIIKSGRKYGAHAPGEKHYRTS